VLSVKKGGSILIIGDVPVPGVPEKDQSSTTVKSMQVGTAFSSVIVRKP
jgi:hypothetical protein